MAFSKLMDHGSDKALDFIVGTCDKSSSVLAETEGMTMSGSTLSTRRGLAPRTSMDGLDEEGDSSKEGREKCWPRICIFLIISFWEACCLANYTNIFH
jgi:hypothetical protein